MFRLNVRTSVPAIDISRLVAMLPALARRWRALRFERGCYLHDDGRLREGLRVVHGSHSRPGARYRLLTRREVAEPMAEGAPPPGTPASAFTTMLMELLADDARRIRFRLRSVDSGVVTEVEFERPNRPARLLVEVTAPVGGGWLTRGAVSAHLELDLDALPPARSDVAQLIVQAEHRRARGTAQVRFEEVGGGLWSVGVEIQAAGRGLARPVVAVLAPFARSYVAREVDALLGQLAKSVGELNRELDAQFGPGCDIEQAVAALHADFLDAVPAGDVEDLPPAPTAG